MFWLVRGAFGLAIFASAGTIGALAQTADDDLEMARKVLDRFALEVPALTAVREPVRQALFELSREPCDQKAIVNLAAALERVGYKREGAKAHLKFSELCGGHTASLRAATNIFLSLSDYKSAAAAATDLIDAEPLANNGYFLRALADEKLGQWQKAVNDYGTAIELFADKSRISSVSYQGMARAYDKLGQYCNAATALETWVAIRPAQHDTSQSRTMITSYLNKGACSFGTGANEEVFPNPRPGSVVTVSALINDVRGNFVLDTGATFVSLKEQFAKKAKVDIDAEGVIKLHTANGITEGRNGRAKSIQLKSLSTKDVPIVIQADKHGAYGDKIDGLLGMSFLSRFSVTVDGQVIKIRKRTAR